MLVKGSASFKVLRAEGTSRSKRHNRCRIGEGKVNAGSTLANDME